MIRVREILENVERRLRSSVTGQSAFETEEALDELERIFRALLAKEEWSWAVVHANPIAKTYTGHRTYPLPDNFGDFLRTGNEDGSRPTVKISDGTAEDFLDYEPPERFFSEDREVATNERPNKFTISYSAEGHPQLELKPPPDSNSDSHYTIRGAYRISYRHFEEDSLLPDQTNDYLYWALIVEHQPENQRAMAMLEAARQDLYLNEAKLKDSVLVPRMSSDAGLNEWEGAWSA